MPNEASAAHTTAWGAGLYEATIGEPAKFKIQARDAALNNRMTEQVTWDGS